MEDQDQFINNSLAEKWSLLTLTSTDNKQLRLMCCLCPLPQVQLLCIDMCFLCSRTQRTKRSQKHSHTRRATCTWAEAPKEPWVSKTQHSLVGSQTLGAAAVAICWDLRVKLSPKQILTLAHRSPETAFPFFLPAEETKMPFVSSFSTLITVVFQLR